MKIYTRTGDDGRTALYGGARTFKHDARVCAYGAVDEANAHIGQASAAALMPVEVQAQLVLVMRDLFDIGAELATPDDASASLKARTNLLPATRATALEVAIDAAESELAPLSTFILPGGSDAAARLHVARTLVRRAEREVVSFAQHHPVRGEVITYLNRLSDALFVWARLANRRVGVDDVAWTPRG